MEEVIRTRFTQEKLPLDNPHKGCCTFQHFNGDELFPGEFWDESGPLDFKKHARNRPLKGHVDGYLPSTVSYCRWFWRDFEPEEAVYDFSMIDKSLEAAHKSGQTLAVRLMPFGSTKQPPLPGWYVKKYPCESSPRKSTEIVVPKYDSEAYLDRWGGVLAEFARRYDSDPRLESFDIAYIGPWGEGDGDCSLLQSAKFADLYARLFKNTPLLSLIGGDQFSANLAKGTGWRCDCFGDLKQFGSETVRLESSYCHMYDCYPKQIALSNAGEAWKKAPVHFETCWVPAFWRRHGFDLDFTIQQGLKYHGTYFMPKYTRLPDDYIERLADFCHKLGYIFTFRHSLVSRQAPHGSAIRFEAWIENTGVAPIYRKYDFSVRFRQDDREEIVVLDGVDIRNWLPGDAWIAREIKIPSWTRKGLCEIAAGLTGKDKKVKVLFDAHERFRDGWLDLGFFEIL